MRCCICQASGGRPVACWKAAHQMGRCHAGLIGQLLQVCSHRQIIQQSLAQMLYQLAAAAVGRGRGGAQIQQTLQ
jgi:hypothetical protein